MAPRIQFPSFLPALLALGLTACVSPPEFPTGKGSMRGTVALDAGITGDVFVFLHAASDPPVPLGSGRPVQLSAIPQPRAFEGSPPSPEFVFASVDPGAYLVRAVVDARHLFDPYVDVLAQPFAGDAVLAPVEVSVAAERESRVKLADGGVAAWEPPIFEIDSPASRQLTLQSGAPSISLLHLHTRALPFADGSKLAFLYGPADADGDGKLDDLDGDGLPDIYPRVVLQRIPQSDDGPELRTADGGALSIILPALAFPDPDQLDENLGPIRAIDGLSVAVVTLAFVVEGPDGAGHVRTRQLPAPPLGSYRLTVIQGTGQYWQVPNGLAPGGLFAARHGGPDADQDARIAVVAGP